MILRHGYFLDMWSVWRLAFNLQGHFLDMIAFGIRGQFFWTYGKFLGHSKFFGYGQFLDIRVNFWK